MRLHHLHSPSQGLSMKRQRAKVILEKACGEVHRINHRFESFIAQGKLNKKASTPLIREGGPLRPAAGVA
jgi:hypothetical protein